MNLDAPAIGDAGAGMVIVGAEDPLLYVVKIAAILVLLVAVLVIICEPERASS